MLKEIHVQVSYQTVIQTQGEKVGSNILFDYSSHLENYFRVSRADIKAMRCFNMEIQLVGFLYY